MKKILHFLLGAGLLLSLTNCSRDSVTPTTPKVPEVKLQNLEAGQTSSFVRYQTTCADIHESFSFTGDTLVLEVIKVNDTLFFKESLTAMSPMFLNGNFQEPIIYPVSTDGQELKLPERDRSALFFFYANDIVQLFPKDEIVLYQDACKLFNDNDPFIGNDIGSLSSFTIGPLQVEDKTAISCEPFFNLDAYLIYDADHLYMSHVITIEDFNGQILDDVVLGWVML